MQTSAQLVINSTYDYNLFKFYPANREPKHWPKIAESIGLHDLTPYIPILVNKDYYIIDGQNRFLACKVLKKPIYYIVGQSLTEGDIRTLNTYQEKWTPDDYLNFFVEHENPDYIRMKMTRDETGLGVGKLMRIWQSGKDRGKKSTTSLFKSGKFRFPDAAVKKCRQVSSVLFVAENSFGKILNKDSLTNAISSAITGGINPNELISSIKKNAFLFKSQAGQDGYRDMLEGIYNYRRREKVSFKYWNK